MQPYGQSVQTDGPIQFTAPSGRSFVYLTSGFMRKADLMYSPNGTTFYVTYQEGFGGNTTEHGISFYAPQINLRGQLQRNGDTIEFDGETYVRQNECDTSTMDVRELLAVFREDHLCRANDGRYLLIVAELLAGRTYVFFDGRLVQPTRHLTSRDLFNPETNLEFDGHSVYLSNDVNTFDDQPLTVLDPEHYSFGYQHELEGAMPAVEITQVM